MKDAYSFDLSDDDAALSYNKMFFAYLKTFERLGLKSIPMKADTGPIGGDLSHEFIILAETGESKIYTDKRYSIYQLKIIKMIMIGHIVFGILIDKKTPAENFKEHRRQE